MVEEHSRPNPNELLARVKTEQEHKKRGRLKIFLGYAPGVGKTYTMLEAARVRGKDTDVVAACVETHGRAETEALMKGLEVIPRSPTEYHGITLFEMDIDAVLKRHPQLALVDELAHENAPGSRHSKRYQDVEELIGAGIDVYTTVNIQHLESGRNVVAQITGVWVHETVPDSFVDRADEIELVDLPPDELIRRLKEGKVYVPEQIARATQAFFRKGNLTALRELTMRTAARHVDQQTLDYMKAHGLPGPWPSGERVLLAIYPGSWGTRLVRSARRLAYGLGAEWVALFVETPGCARLSSEEHGRIADSLGLAQRLGAKAVTIQRDSVTTGVIEYARANNVTKIVVAKPRTSIWRILTRDSVVNQIIRRSEDIDVHLVRAGTDRTKRGRRRAASNPDWRGSLQGLGLVALATLLGKLLPAFFAPTNMIMVYLLCVVAAAFLWGFGPSVLVSVASVLAFDTLFVPPFLTLKVADTKYVFTFFVLLFVGLVISYLMRRIRQHTEVIADRERQTATLYALGRELAMSDNLASYVRIITERAKETFGHDAVVFLPDARSEETLKPYTEDTNIVIGENELAAASWSFQHQSSAGPGTDTLPNARARFVPMGTARGTVGVLALAMTDTRSKLPVEQERLLQAYADLAAVALESILLGEEARNIQVLRDTEKLQTALLNAVSHDLRTPLVSIIGVLSSLQEEGMDLDDAAKQNLIGVAREEAERLNHLITNLLDVSRIEAGATKISRQPSVVQDLVGAALEEMGGRARAREIRIATPLELPLVNVDFGLIVQTLVNIVDNALKYSPSGSAIDIQGRQVADEVHIEISDRGVGVPTKDLSHIFDKFYRLQSPDNVAGTGLGLSICKGIAEAHGGRIEAENRPGGGTTIRFILPMLEPENQANEELNVG
jgi:two-component system, OmpR family, sensor histidine kinase KdpD